MCIITFFGTNNFPKDESRNLKDHKCYLVGNKKINHFSLFSIVFFNCMEKLS